MTRTLSLHARGGDTYAPLELLYRSAPLSGRSVSWCLYLMCPLALANRYVKRQGVYHMPWDTLRYTQSECDCNCHQSMPICLSGSCMVT